MKRKRKREEEEGRECKDEEAKRRMEGEIM